MKRHARTAVLPRGALASTKANEMQVTPMRSGKDATGKDHGRLQKVAPITARGRAIWAEAERTEPPHQMEHDAEDADKAGEGRGLQKRHRTVCGGKL